MAGKIIPTVENFREDCGPMSIAQLMGRLGIIELSGDLPLSESGKMEVDSSMNGAVGSNFTKRIPDVLLDDNPFGLTPGYLARAVVVASMPHRKPEGDTFIRKAGSYTLIMRAQDTEIGLPYGIFPRLFLAWLTTEVVLKKSRVIVLGKSLSNFLEFLDLKRTGGKKGNITMVKEQLKRILNTAFSSYYSNDTVHAGMNMFLADKYEIWWATDDAEQPGLAESTITLSEVFYNEIMAHAVPFSMEALRVLRQSPMALDIYMWLTYRNGANRRSHTARHPVTISWELLQEQFGASYAEDRKGKFAFKRKFKIALDKVAAIYREARKLEIRDEGLYYVPGRPHIQKISKLLS